MPWSWFPLWVLIGDWLLRLGLAALIIFRRRPVSTSLAWLAILVFVPFVGLILYLLVGEVRLGSRRLKRYEELTKRLEEHGVSLWRHRQAQFDVNPNECDPIARFGTAVSGTPPLRGNGVTLLNNADDTIDCIAQEVLTATSHVHMLFYIWDVAGAGPKMADALIRTAQRGVACRILVDAVASKAFLRSEICARMRAAGVQVVAALPASPLRMLFHRIDLRNHRKVCVIDGRIAYCGSQNITDHTFRSKRWRKTGPWVDAMVRVEGPAAQALAVVFLRDWLLDSSERIDDITPFMPDLPQLPPDDPGQVVQVIPSGPGAIPTAIHQAILTAIYSAREELIMTTPYFVPDEATLKALQSAALRGVAVTLVMPRVSDSVLVAAASRAYYLELLEAGVRILHYKPGLLHAKTITIDRIIGLIGSANLDARSFFLNFEITLFLFDDDFASVLRFMQTGYIDQSDEVHLEDWKKRPVWQTFRDNAAQLLGPLL